MIANEIREYLKLTCEALNKKEVEYMLIGGVAVGFYGYQRISGGYNPDFPELNHDLDFWYNPTTSNYYRIVESLKTIGVDTDKLDDLIFDPQKTYLRIPAKGFKIEFLPQMKGLTSYKSSVKNSRKIVLDGNQILIIGLDDLIINKEAVGREIDKRDVFELTEIKNRK